MNVCLTCHKNFEFSSQEKEFLSKLSPVIAGKSFEIPPPKLCRTCRMRRRLAFRNDYHLYKRASSKSGQTIVSIYSEDKPFPVYSISEWWSDEYDPKSYGRDFDSSRPFFEQIAELSLLVPRLASPVVNCENCDYTAFSVQSRNCYLSSRLGDSEDVYYSYLALYCRTCVDCYNITSCEMCYECVDTEKCYECIYTDRSKNSSNLMFCSDLIGCHDCFACTNLAQKSFCFFNEQLTKDEYQKRVGEFYDGTQNSLERCLVAFNEHRKKYPVRATVILNAENVFGSYIFESRNAINSFDIVHSEDVINTTQSEYSKDVMDCDFQYHTEHSYEVIAHSGSMRNAFCFAIMNGNSDVFYSMDCHNNNQNLFGCIGMKNSRYCILNKQYTRAEYEILVPKIIEHMQKSGEWGEFFPIVLSPVAYNESEAQDKLPLTREEALSSGFKWHETQLKDRPFNLIPQEIAFYKRMNLCTPTLHPEVRHKNRLARRNPYFLHETVCRKCQRKIWTDQSEKKSSTAMSVI